MDHSGAFVVTPQFASARDFHEGLAEIKSGDLWGYVNVRGTFEIDPAFRHTGEFSEGLARVQCPDGPEEGFINHSGELVIPPTFLEAAVFRAGRCHVRTHREIGYIDPSGQFVWRGPDVDVAVGLDILI